MEHLTGFPEKVLNKLKVKRVFWVFWLDEQKTTQTA